MSSKVKEYTGNLSALAGDVNYTGVGFQPTSMTVMWTNNDGKLSFGTGFCDSALGQSVIGGWYSSSGTVGTVSHANYFIWDYTMAGMGAYQTALVKNYGIDGFTLTWAKTGSPTGTITFEVIAYK